MYSLQRPHSYCYRSNYFGQFPPAESKNRCISSELAVLSASFSRLQMLYPEKKNTLILQLTQVQLKERYWRTSCTIRSCFSPEITTTELGKHILWNVAVEAAGFLILLFHSLVVRIKVVINMALNIVYKNLVIGKGPL